MLWVCLGGAAQLIVVSAVWSWLPSFLNRFHGLPPDQAGGARGDGGAGRRRRQRDLGQHGRPCRLAPAAPQAVRDGADLHRRDGGAAADLRRYRLGSLRQSSQFALIALGGFLMTCSVGPVSAIVIDVIHPGVRATGASVLALFQNLFGLAAGPFLVGMLSDASGWTPRMTHHPGVRAAGRLLLPARLAQLRGRHAARRRRCAVDAEAAAAAVAGQCGACPSAA